MIQLKKLLVLTLPLILLSQNLFAGDDKVYDYLIKNAIVFDGESWKGQKLDIAIRGERIAKLGRIQPSLAREIIDAKGLTIAPGFIDAHTHSDFNPFVYPLLPNKIMQGVTSEVTGNCGMSAAPILGTHGERVASTWAREGVLVPKKLEWSSFEEYRKAIQHVGSYTNLVSLVGHGNIRSAVMGFSPRPASAGEIEDMKKILREAMQQGARGISYGLVYVPGIFAEENELIELCREAAKNSGVCAFHIRNEGSGLLEAINEAIRIGEKAQAPIQISHLKAAGKNNWKKIDEAFKLIEKARLRGVEVVADAYPYTASYAELGVILPDAIYSREDRVAYFKNPIKRDEIYKILAEHYELRKMRWDSIMIAAVSQPGWEKYEGMTIKDIARETDKAPEMFLIEILAANNFEVSAFSFSQSDEVIGKVLDQLYVSVGSDSIADGSRRPHPRAFGTFPKVFKSQVRSGKKIKIGEAIRKMTSLPAKQFRMTDRGQIKEGWFADLVVFDAGEIRDDATYEKPTAFGQGIQWVFVNGKLAVKKGKPTAQKNGRLL